MERIAYDTIKVISVLILFCLVVAVPVNANFNTLIDSNIIKFNPLPLSVEFSTYDKDIYTLGAAFSGTSRINRSGDFGLTFSLLSFNFGDSGKMAIDEINLLHVISKNGGQMHHIYYNISDGTFSPDATIDTAAQQNGEYYPIPRRNGSIAVLTHGSIFDDQQLYESADRGATWNLKLTFTGEAATFITATETSDGILHTFRAGDGATIRYNWTYANVSKNYIKSTTIKIKDGIFDPPATTVKPNDNTIYAIVPEVIPNRNSVLWFTTIDGITKAIASPKVILNYSDMNVSHSGIFLDTANNNLYILFSNKTFSSVVGNCYLIKSTNGGLNWTDREAIGSNGCGKAQMGGRFTWLPNAINTRTKPWLDIVYINKSTNNDHGNFTYFRYDVLGTVGSTIKRPQNDTFVINGGCNGTRTDNPNNFLNLNTTSEHGNDTYVLTGDGCTDLPFTPPNFMALMKWNRTGLSNHLIDSLHLQFNYSTNVSARRTSFDQSIFYLKNSTWRDNITWLEAPEGFAEGIGSINPFEPNGNLTSIALDTSNSGFMNELYNTSLFSLFMSQIGGVVLNPSDSAWFASLQSNDPERLRFALSDIQTGTVRSTDTSTFRFDFEAANTSNTQYVDFIYEPATNILTYNTGGQNFAFAGIGLDLTTQVTCGAEHYNLIFTPVGITANQEVYCFNLTRQHNGEEFYGAIKILNNTNVRGGAGIDFDFQYALYSPNYVVFSAPEYSPNPQQAGLNLTVTWLTSIPLTTELRFTVNLTNGTLIPLNTVFGDSGALVTTHNAIINKDFMTYGTYFITLYGNSSSGLQFNTTTYNFTIGQAFNNRTAPLPRALDDLVDSGFCSDFTTCTYIFGLALLAFASLFAFFYGGLQLGLAAFTTMAMIESLVGLLPIFLIVPLIVITALVVVNLFRKSFTSGGGE